MTKEHCCKKCEQVYPLTADNFYRNSSSSTGFDKTCKFCRQKDEKENRHKRPCRAPDYKKAKRVENKETIVEIFGNKCECCGKSFHASAYDFHHKDPSTKSFSISKRYTLNKAMVCELAKCDMLCRNCHAALHAGEIKYDPTKKMYYKLEWDSFGEVYVKKPVKM